MQIVPICAIENRQIGLDGKVTVKMKLSQSLDLRLLKILAQRWNFRYQLVDSQQNWGTFVNDSWTGSIALIRNNLVDMGICGISQTYLRNLAVDYSFFITIDKIGFLSQFPSKSSRKWLLFQSFPWQNWLAILISYILIWIFLHLYYCKICPLLLMNHHHHRSRSKENLPISMKLCAIYLNRGLNFFLEKMIRFFLKKINFHQ